MAALIYLEKHLEERATRQYMREAGFDEFEEIVIEEDSDSGYSCYTYTNCKGYGNGPRPDYADAPAAPADWNQNYGSFYESESCDSHSYRCRQWNHRYVSYFHDKDEKHQSTYYNSDSGKSSWSTRKRQHDDTYYYSDDDGDDVTYYSDCGDVKVYDYEWPRSKNFKFWRPYDYGPCEPETTQWQNQTDTETKTHSQTANHQNQKTKTRRIDATNDTTEPRDDMFSDDEPLSDWEHIIPPATNRKYGVESKRKAAPKWKRVSWFKSSTESKGHSWSNSNSKTKSQSTAKSRF